MFYRVFRLFLLLTVLSGCTELPYTNLDNAQLKNMIEQGAPIYDIRRAEEWRQTGVIEDSQLLTFMDAGGRMRPDFLLLFTRAVGKEDPVILICRTGNRTSMLARHLVEEMGFTQVYNVRNGITQWINDGHAITRVSF
jgi:rhodanese-related sulfurtransferase